MGQAPQLWSVVTLSPFHLVTLSFLFVAACMGHTTLLAVSLNWSYGVLVHRGLLRLLRKVIFVLVAAGPLLFWSLCGFDRGLWLDPELLAGWGTLTTAYVILCCLVGLVLFPVMTLKRLCRRRPEALLSNHTETVDVAGQLGFKPVGRGKYRHLARLPRNEIFQVDFSVKTFRLPQLPAAWDGLTILHLSDLHFCGTPDREFYRYVLDHCNRWEPDLVAVTGDIVDSSKHHRWVVPLLGRLRWKEAAYAILGNHDSWREPPLIRRRLKRIGMRVLANTWEEREVRGERLVVIGHEGPWFQPEPDLSECPAGGFRLCLSHTPDNIRWAQKHGIDLMLAGHNHGGQIRLPVIGSILVPSRYSRRYDCGSFDEPPTLLHVSRGLAGQHPLRYNCRPEVTLIELRR
jgi:predicted MPP superfamily phosphohydrolase